MADQLPDIEGAGGLNREATPVLVINSTGTASNDAGPADRFVAITPADTALAVVPKALYVGGAGNLVVKGSDGVQATLAVAANSYHPIRPRNIMAATTATSIVALY